MGETVGYVELRHAEGGHSGPFWTDEEFIGADYEDVHACLGITRVLFDDAVLWSETGGDYERKVALLRRLRAEVHPNIAVERPLDIS